MAAVLPWATHAISLSFGFPFALMIQQSRWGTVARYRERSSLPRGLRGRWEVGEM